MARGQRWRAAEWAADTRLPRLSGSPWAIGGTPGIPAVTIRQPPPPLRESERVARPVATGFRGEREAFAGPSRKGARSMSIHVQEPEQRRRAGGKKPDAAAARASNRQAVYSRVTGQTIAAPAQGVPPRVNPWTSHPPPG